MVWQRVERQKVAVKVCDVEGVLTASLGQKADSRTLCGRLVQYVAAQGSVLVASRHAVAAKGDYLSQRTTAG